MKLSDVFPTLQVYLGSLYVNDFNKFGRTYQVIAQADAPFRSHVEDILPAQDSQRERRDGAARLVADVKAVVRPGSCAALQRLSAPLTSTAAPRRASAPARRRPAMAKFADETLPQRHGLRVDRADLPAESLAGNTAFSCSRCACCSCSWCWPRSTRAVVAAGHHPDRADVLCCPRSPACGSLGGDNNIFTQIGFIVLVGLACKNAILIVEFAKHLQEERGH